MPALLALVFGIGGAVLLVVSARMTPPPAPPEELAARAEMAEGPRAGASAPAVGGEARQAAPASAQAAGGEARQAAPASAQAAGGEARQAAAASAPTPGGHVSPGAAADRGVMPQAATGQADGASPGQDTARSAEGMTPIIELRSSSVICYDPRSGTGRPTGEPCSSQRLRGRLLEHRADLEACLSVVPESRRGVHGKVAVRGRWSMGDPPAGGRLISVRPLKNAPKDRAFLSCVRQVLGKLLVTPGVCPACFAEMTVTLSY